MGFGMITIENYVSVVKRLFDESAPIAINPAPIELITIPFVFIL